jgi:hypothetical protein
LIIGSNILENHYRFFLNHESSTVPAVAFITTTTTIIIIIIISIITIIIIDTGIDIIDPHVIFAKPDLASPDRPLVLWRSIDLEAAVIHHNSRLPVLKIPR